MIFISSLLLAAYAWVSFSGYLNYGDCLSYASVSRSIVEGLGIYQNSYPPVGLAQLGHYPSADFTQSLGLPLFQAIFFKIFGARDWVAAMVSCLTMVGWISVAGLLARRFLTTKATLGLFFIVLVFNPFLLPYSISGLTEPLFALVLVSAIFVYLKNPSSVFCAFGFGALLACCHLVRSTTLFYWPAFIYLLFVAEKNPRFSKSHLALIFGFVLVQIPLFIRSKMALEHNIFISLPQAVFLDLDHDYFIRILRSVDPFVLKQDLLPYVLEHASDYIFRTLRNLGSLLYHLLIRDWGLNFIFLPFVGSFFLRFQRREEHVFVRFTQILFICSLGGFSIAWPITRYFYPIVPFVGIVAIMVLVQVAAKMFERRAELRTRFIYAFAAMAVLITLGVQLKIMRANDWKRLEFKWAYLPEFIDRNLPEGASIVTNIPDLVSWHGGAHRKAILFPNTLEDLATIDSKFVKVDGILITDDVNGLSTITSEDPWNMILRDPQNTKIPGFVLAEVYDQKKSRAVLFKRDL